MGPSTQTSTAHTDQVQALSPIVEVIAQPVSTYTDQHPPTLPLHCKVAGIQRLFVRPRQYTGLEIPTNALHCPIDINMLNRYQPYPYVKPAVHVPVPRHSIACSSYPALISLRSLVRFRSVTCYDSANANLMEIHLRRGKQLFLVVS
jgi:hypothetical protein